MKPAVLPLALLVMGATIIISCTREASTRKEQAQVLTEWRRHPSVEEEFNSSKYVFVGKAVSATNVLYAGDFIAGTFYKVRVEDGLKGSVPTLVEIYDENSSGRFPMKVGVSYLLFVNEQFFEGIAGSRLAIDNCGNSGMPLKRNKALEKVRELKKAKAKPLSNREGH